MATLTPRQARFVEEYLIDLNGAQAAIRAGYKAVNARNIAYGHLAKPHIQAAIAEGRKQQAERLQISADWVLHELRRVYYKCIEDDPGKGRFDSAGANRSLELIGRHLNMFKDKVEIEIGQDAVYLELMAIVRARMAAKALAVSEPQHLPYVNGHDDATDDDAE